MSARIHIHASFSARWSVHGRPIVVRTQKLGSIGSRCMHARTDTPSRHKSGTILANETVHLPGIVGRRRGDPRPRRNCEHCLMRAGPVSNPIATVFFATLEIHPQCPTRFHPGGFGNLQSRVHVQEFCHPRGWNGGKSKMKRVNEFIMLGQKI